MSQDDKIIVGLSHGDINGVSYELILKIVSDVRIAELFTPIIYGATHLVDYYKSQLELESLELNTIFKLREYKPNVVNLLSCVRENYMPEMGEATELSNKCMRRTLEIALKALDSGRLSALVMCPYAKEGLDLDGGILSLLTKRYEARTVMSVAVGENIKLAFAEQDLSLVEITKKMKKQYFIDRFSLLYRSLVRDFCITNPRVAVLGLDDYSNENYIMPAIETLRQKGKMVFGVFDHKYLFDEYAYLNYDAVFVLSNEQIEDYREKLLGLESAILYIGINQVITTTFHGIASDIVGQNKATEAELRNACYLASDVYRNRKLDRQLRSNKLPSYNVGGNSRESDVNVEKLVGVENE